MMKFNNFDNLILLIGTNPLPNFVVADYFLQSKIVNENIYIFQTYTYSIENYKCLAESLNRICRQITKENYKPQKLKQSVGSVNQTQQEATKES